jgi:hypothetical protein
VAAENWVLQMEKLMEVMCCTDEQMVPYATFKFTAEAEHWWTSNKDHFQQQLGEGVPITWKNFNDAFLERFFPQSVSTRIHRPGVRIVDSGTICSKVHRTITIRPIPSSHRRLKGKKVQKGFTT